MSYDWSSRFVPDLTSTAPHSTTRGLFGPRTPLPPPAGIAQPTEIAQLKQNIDSALDRLHSSIEATERESTSREAEKAAQAAQTRMLTEALASFRERKAASERAVGKLFDQRVSDDEAFKHMMLALLEEWRERGQEMQKELDKVFADSAECVTRLEQALKAITVDAEDHKPRRSAWQQLHPTFPSAPIDIAAPSTAPQPITVTEGQYLSGPDPDFFDFSSLTLRPADTWNDACSSSPQETTDSQSFSVPTISEASSPPEVRQPPPPGWSFEHRPMGARDKDLWDILQLEQVLVSPSGTYTASSPVPARQNERNPAPARANALESIQPCSANGPSSKHDGVRCAYCRVEITGANWQCITCTDVNVCMDCEAAGIVEPLHTKHTSSHFMMMLNSSVTWAPPKQQHNAAPASIKAPSSLPEPSHPVPTVLTPPLRTARSPSVNSMPSLETVTESSSRSSIRDRQSPPASAFSVERLSGLRPGQPPRSASSVCPSSSSFQPPVPFGTLPVPGAHPSTKAQRTAVHSEYVSLPDKSTQRPLPTSFIVQQPPQSPAPSARLGIVIPPSARPAAEGINETSSYAPWPMPPGCSYNIPTPPFDPQPPCSTNFVHRSSPINREPLSVVQQVHRSPVASSGRPPVTVVVPEPRSPIVRSESIFPGSPVPRPVLMAVPPSSGALPPPHLPARASWNYRGELSRLSSPAESNVRPRTPSTVCSRSPRSPVWSMRPPAPTSPPVPPAICHIVPHPLSHKPPTVIPPPQANFPAYCPIRGSATPTSRSPMRTLSGTQAHVSLSCLHTRFDELKDGFRFPPRLELTFGIGNVIINVPTGPAMLDGLARMPMDTDCIGFAEPSSLNHPLCYHLAELRDILTRLRDVKHACLNKMSIADVQTPVEREIERVERWKDMVRVAGAAWMLEQAAFIKAPDAEGVRMSSFNDGPLPIYSRSFTPYMPSTLSSDSSGSSHFVLPQCQGIVSPAPVQFFPQSPERTPVVCSGPQWNVGGGIDPQSKRRQLPAMSSSQAHDALEYVHAQLAVLKARFVFPATVDIQMGSSIVGFLVPTVPDPRAIDVLTQLPLDSSRILFPKDTSNKPKPPFQSHLEHLSEVLYTVRCIKCMEPEAVAEHRWRVESAVLEEMERVERWKRMVRVAAAASLVKQTAGIRVSGP